MKTVLWKPSRKWTGQTYSQYPSNNRYIKDNTVKSGAGMDLTSQDSLVEDRNHDTHSQGDSGYQLSAMGFGKRRSDEEQDYEFIGNGVVKIPLHSQQQRPEVEAFAWCGEGAGD